MTLQYWVLILQAYLFLFILQDTADRQCTVSEILRYKSNCVCGLCYGLIIVNLEK